MDIRLLGTIDCDVLKRETRRGRGEKERKKKKRKRRSLE